MKNIIIFSTVLFWSLISFGQSDSTMNSKTGKTSEYKTREMSNTDGVTMKNGTMMTVKNGQMTNMTTDRVYKNGTRISIHGSISKKDGSEMMLKEGEYMDVYGKVIPVNNTKNPSDRNSSKSNKEKNMYLVPDSTLRKK